MSPLRERVWDGSQWVGHQGGSVPEPEFILGVTEPTPFNTGCRIPINELHVHNGNVTTTHPITGQPLGPGSVVEGVLVTGRIHPQLGGITYRDCVVTGASLPHNTDFYEQLIDMRSTGSAAPCIFEFVSCLPAVLSFRNYGIQGGNFIARRMYIKNVTDAFSPHGSSSVVKTVDLEGNYSEDFYVDVDPNQQDLITHNDFIQAAGGLSRLRIVGNAVGHPGRPRTSNILIQNNPTLVPWQGEGVTIDRNWFRGNEVAGSTINCPVNINVPFVLTNNIVYSTGNTPRNLIQSTLRNAVTTTIANNIDENGSPTPINNA